MSVVLAMSIEKCSRSVHPPKSKQQEPINFWDKLIKTLEQDASIPSYKRLDLLEQIFPNQLFHKICDVLNMRPKYAASQPSLPETLQSHHQSISTETNRYNIGPINPYLAFFKRTPERAAIWYPLPPLSLNEMHLTQKAATITERIAQDFVNWMKELCQQDGVTPTTLTVREIIKMFEIGFNTQAARTLCVRFKEIASIPDQVANLKQLPQFARRNMLFLQIQRDIIASEQTRKLHSFGRILPPELQIHPPNYEIIENDWLKCGQIRDDLQAMATVFKDITHLSITRGFCKYLVEHPDIRPPTFIRDSQMLDRKYFENFDGVIDDDDEEEEEVGEELLPPMTENEVENVKEDEDEDVMFDDELSEEEDKDDEQI